MFFVVYSFPATRQTTCLKYIISQVLTIATRTIKKLDFENTIKTDFIILIIQLSAYFLSMFFYPGKIL